jgi:hypothetical protein
LALPFLLVFLWDWQSYPLFFWLCSTQMKASLSCLRSILPWKWEIHSPVG